MGSAVDCNCCAPCGEADANDLARCTPYRNGVLQLGITYGGDCTPETTACEFRGVAVPKDRNTVVTVTDVGDIWRSTNMGINWTKTAIGTPLNAIHFQKTRGVIVGDGGLILRSIDSGENWSAPTTNPATVDLYCVRITGSIVMVCGHGGTILRSDDSGRNFFAQTSGTTNALWALWFSNSQRGYCVGDGGIVLRTIDGGATWESLTGMSGDGRGVVARKKAPGALVEIVSVDSGRSYLWTVSGDTVIGYSVFDATGLLTPPHIFPDGLIAKGMTLTDCFGEDGYASYVWGSNTVVSPFDGLLHPGWICREPHTSTCAAAYPTPILAAYRQSDERGWQCAESTDTPLTGANLHENRDGDPTPYTQSEFTLDSGAGQTFSDVSLTQLDDDGSDVPCLNLHLEWTQNTAPPISYTSDRWGTHQLFELDGGPHWTIAQGDYFTFPTISFNVRIASLSRPAGLPRFGIVISPYVRFVGHIYDEGFTLRTPDPTEIVYGVPFIGVAVGSNDPRSSLWRYGNIGGFISGSLDTTSPIEFPNWPFDDDFYVNPVMNHRRPGDYYLGWAVSVAGNAIGDYAADIHLDNICFDYDDKGTTPSGCSSGTTSYEWDGSGWRVVASACIAGATCNPGFVGHILGYPAPFVGEIRTVPCSYGSDF